MDNGWKIGAVRHVSATDELWMPGWVKGNFGLTIVQCAGDMMLGVSVTHLLTGLRVAVIADKLLRAASLAEDLEAIGDWATDDVSKIKEVMGPLVEPVFVAHHAAIYRGKIFQIVTTAFEGVTKSAIPGGEA